MCIPIPLGTVATGIKGIEGSISSTQRLLKWSIPTGKKPSALVFMPFSLMVYKAALPARWHPSWLTFSVAPVAFGPFKPFLVGAFVSFRLCKQESR